MLDAVSHVGVWVHDQDEAKAFYTEKLGFEVREDVNLGELGGDAVEAEGGRAYEDYRWLTVGPPGRPEVNLILSKPGPPGLDDATAKQLLELVAKGAMGPGILRTEDCRKTCKELEDRGVELTSQPEERFYGIDATVRDPSGNLWRIVQPVEYDVEAMKKG
jgi:catechol 2,3-dioxygenase-like lactoylglutathione lyase family enzyme